MTKSDYNSLSGEKHLGPMNELVAIRDRLVDAAADKALASALAMDHQAITEMAMAASVQAPTGPEMLQDADPAAMHAAYVAAGNAPAPQPVAQEQTILTEDDSQDPGYIDRMAAEARVEQSYADAGARSDYELAA